MAERTYGGVTADRRRGDRRERLLEAGLELLGSEGRSGTTVRAVCRVAGLGPRYFYESFETVEDLYVAVLDQVLAEAASEVVAAVLAAPSDPSARARAALEGFIGCVVDDPRRARIVFVEAVGSERMIDRRSAAVDGFAELAAGQARTLFGDAPGSGRLVRATALLIAGGIAEVLHSYVRGELEASREELIADLAELVVGAGASAAAIAGRRHGPG